MTGGSSFVPNDSVLDRDARRVTILTGPNMAGKSTYIRQTALIVLLAQVGSFVPARKAKIGVVDRIFTRVGAADDISRNASTFMVEMVEVANILNNSSARSLVVLDEVGRGTSTFDGLALAWSIVEHIHDRIGCRTLFATHYHQLVELATRLPGVCNKSVAVREYQDEIVFLHKIVDGGTDRSYGIHVARLAGVPADLLERARSILRDLEADNEDLVPRISSHASGAKAPTGQLSLFGTPPSKVEAALARLDPDDPWRALLGITDPVERVAVASFDQLALKESDLSSLVIEAVSAQATPEERAAVSLVLYLHLRDTPRISASAAETLAGQLTRVLRPAIDTHQVHGRQFTLCREVASLCARLSDSPGDAYARNLLNAFLPAGFTAITPAGLLGRFRTLWDRFQLTAAAPAR